MSSERIAEEIAILEIPMRKGEPSPTPPSSHQSLSTPRIQEFEASVPLIEKIETSDSDLPEKDYESVDLSGNTELDEGWIDVEYPAGSNGWWRVRQRAKGHREGRMGEYLPVEG